MHYVIIKNSAGKLGKFRKLCIITNCLTCDYLICLYIPDENIQLYTNLALLTIIYYNYRFDMNYQLLLWILIT